LFCSALLSLLRTVAKFLLITRCYICEVERNLELQLFCSASSCHERSRNLLTTRCSICEVER
ncbi:unnamed protein product, partial [Porites lobata]